MPDSSGNEFICDSKTPQLGLLIQNYHISNAIPIVFKKQPELQLHLSYDVFILVTSKRDFNFKIENEYRFQIKAQKINDSPCMASAWEL